MDLVFHSAVTASGINERKEALVEYITDSQVDMGNRRKTNIHNKKQRGSSRSDLGFYEHQGRRTWVEDGERAISIRLLTNILEIDILEPRLESKRKLKDTDWEGYRNALGARLRHLKGKYGNDLDWSTEQL